MGGKITPDLNHDRKEMISMKLTSPAFTEGQKIPKQYTGDGTDISPKLQWSDVPDGVKEFALIMDDPDAPRPQPWVHWVIYNIPGNMRELPENLPRDMELAKHGGIRQGSNSWSMGNIGYRGPAPPPGHGRHRYYFKLYALDANLNLKNSLSKDQLLSAIKDHILAEDQLMGTYER